MKRLFAAIAATAVGGALAVGVAWAHGPGPEHPGAGRTISVSGRGTVKLWILHVQRGCHSWTDGKKIGETVQLTINRGGRLKILNQDLDGHKLVQTKGPRVVVGGPMEMNRGTVVVFRKAGLYRFKTRTFEMPNLPEVKTMGPDHALFLVVRVK